MALLADYLSHDAIGLAQLVARREVSARELLDAAIDRADALNPALNAIVLSDYAAARERAAQGALLGPFAGVPYLVKDLGAAVAGLPLSMGSRHYRHYVPTEDSPLIARTKAAGFNIFGKTNTSECGQVPYTESALFGACRNPWSLDHTPGGSSGGAAAAVAAGIVPLAHASDGGGSIRIPASCCGLFGFKPSHDPAAALRATPGNLVVEHAISRSVRDSAFLLDVTSGRAASGRAASGRAVSGDAAVYGGAYLDALNTPPASLKIGYITDPMLAPALSPDVRDALDDAAKLAASLGHIVEPASFNIDFEQIGEVFLTLWATFAEAAVLDAQQMTGRKPKRAEFEPATWAMAQVGRRFAREQLPRALELQRQITARVAGVVSRYDVILCATLAGPPVKIGELLPTPVETAQMKAVGMLPVKPLLKQMLVQTSRKAFAWAGCTELFNLTGQPAMSVPLYWTPRGLPVGVQFVARHGDDARLFALAHQLELARPWFDKRPPLARAQP
nr:MULTISPECIES: amidase family protein [unclassified Burkholderia]